MSRAIVLGGSYDFGAAKLTADYYTWKNISPRLGFNWKVTDDSKTVLKGHWGRYHRAVATGEYANVLSPSAKDTRRRASSKHRPAC